MIRRVGLVVLAVLLLVAAAPAAVQAGAASRPGGPGARYAPGRPAPGRPAATAPLSWGQIEFRSTAGALTTWSGATSSIGGSATSLDARIPSPSDPAQSFRLTLDMGFSVPITPGTYAPGLHGLNPASFSRDQTSVCAFNGTGMIRVDQYVVDGTGAVTSFAVAFQCPAYGGIPGTWSGTFAYNALPSTPGQGYYLYRQNGALVPSGNDGYLSYLGDLSEHPLNQPIVGMATTADGGGYWLVASDGGIFAFGDAPFLGSMGGVPLNRPIVGMAATADGGGYWLVASDGGIFAFGHAPFLGSMGGSPLNLPVVGMAAAPTGGYWLVASDGGIFAFDAPFWGSTGAIRLNRPVVGMASTPDGGGYWLVAADGGIFTFGHAQFHGSIGGFALLVTIVGMHPTADGSGYWLAATDGGVAALNAPDYSSPPNLDPADVAGIAG